MDFASQTTSSKAYFVTLRHSEKYSFVARLPQAELPHPETFRGNASLSKKNDANLAMIGKDHILGIDTNAYVNRLQWT